MQNVQDIIFIRTQDFEIYTQSVHGLENSKACNKYLVNSVWGLSRQTGQVAQCSN